MKRTLQELNIDFNEQGERMVISRSYHNIVIDPTAGSISFDDADKRRVNQIKQTYTVNWYKNEAIKEGMQLREERHADGKVSLFLTR